MASASFEKLKSPQDVKSKIRHCDKTERLKHGHNNEDINKAVTHTNLQYDRSYEETCKLYDERIEYLDSLGEANKRKDRVTCFGIEIPCPLGLPEDKEESWMNDVNAIVIEQCGKDNVLGMYLHRDEKHEYIDAETLEKKISRTHIHFYVVPEVDGRLNGKKFSSRANIKRLNNAIHAVTQSQYGLDFMDGTQMKSRSSVETLKFKSKELELKERERQLDDRELDLMRREETLKEVNASVNALRAELEDSLKQMEDLSFEYKRGLNELKGALQRYAPHDKFKEIKANVQYQGYESRSVDLDRRRRQLDSKFGDIVEADRKLRRENGMEL